MNLMAIRQVLPLMSQAATVSCTAAFPLLSPIGFDKCFIIRHASRHEAVFHEQMINKKKLFIGFGLLFNPEFIFRNIRKTIMLAKIGKFFINVATNVTPIDKPDCEISTSIYFLEIRWFTLWRHKLLQFFKFSISIGQ